MRRRLDEHRCRRELQTWLDAELDGLVRRSSYRVTPVSGTGSISAAYLVDRAGADEFLRRVEQLEATAGHTLSWSGPWPPYTFVEELQR